MIETGTGLILRTRPLTETSLIVHWLTPDFGRLATVAKGARRPRSPFAGKLDLFYLADFSFQRSRRSELHTLREVVLKETHAALRDTLDSLQQASYATALIEHATEMETPLPEIFSLMTAFLKHLSTAPPRPQSLFAFEIKLLSELGLQPDFEKDRLSPDTRQLLRAFLVGNWPSLSRIKLTSTQVNNLRHFLHGFVVFHLGRAPQWRGG
jgi:DNA repair protein RecO (recombination protein O)